MKKGATFGEGRKHRYTLYRIWDSTLPQINFIGLNPSTADENENDATIKKLIHYTREWGFGGFTITNLFAYRSREAARLLQVVNPVGKKNDGVVVNTAQKHDQIILMWGNQGKFYDRDKKVLDLLYASWSERITKPLCFKHNKNGTPIHPLYLPLYIKFKELLPYDHKG